MKKLITLFILIFIVGTITSEAQRRQRGPRLTKEERVNRMTVRLYVALELNDSQMKAVKSTLKDHLDGIEKLVINSEERPGREQMKELSDARDESLKSVFTEDQYKKYQAGKKRLQQRAQRNRRGFSQRGRRGGRDFRQMRRSGGPRDGGDHKSDHKKEEGKEKEG